MKNFLLACFLVLPLVSISQKVSEKLITKLADYNCACHDTIPLDGGKARIEDGVYNCYLASLTAYMSANKWKDFFNDKTKTDQLQGAVLGKLSGCEKTIELVKKLDEAPVPHETVPDELFLSVKFLKQYKLSESEKWPTYIIWDGDLREPVHQLFDIRWVFDSNEEALAWHRANLSLTSENGQTLNETITLEGAEELHIFRETAEVENAIKQLNLPQRQFNFIFVVDNVVIKIFMGAAKEATLADVKAIPEEAIRLVKQWRSN